MTTSPDQTIKIWDLAGHELVTLRGDSQLTYAEWTPDGSRIVSTWTDGKIRVFESIPWEKLSTVHDEELPFETRLAEWRSLPAP